MPPPSDSARTPLDPRALAVTQHLLVHGPATRAALGRELSLSDASMSRVARSLVRDGIVSEDLDEIVVVARLVRRLERRLAGLDGVGVSLGGVVAERSIVAEGTFLGWRDVDLGSLLRDAVDADVVLTNDVTGLAR